jgi:hypothetical protein
MEGIAPIETSNLPLPALSAAKPGSENFGPSLGRIQCVVLLAEAVDMGVRRDATEPRKARYRSIPEKIAGEFMPLFNV